MTSELTVAQKLDDPRWRDEFFMTILEKGGVRKACEFLHLNKASVYRYASTHPKFEEMFEKAQSVTARMLYDECIEIADEKGTDPRDRYCRIETRMRVAGKLVPKLADRPNTEVNVGVNVGIVCDEQKRARLIELRENLLKSPAQHKLTVSEVEDKALAIVQEAAQ